MRVIPFRRADYLPTLAAMREFTAGRGPDTPDELWLVEHPPVYTLGLAARREHVRDVGEIPLVATERGGQVTYHGPGQVVAYPLLDLRRRRLTVRDLVCRLEQAVIDLCAEFGVTAVRRERAPGVYVGRPDGAKIASVGLRVSRGCSLHGVALNVAMDLSPFERIDPCGYAGQTMTDLAREAAAGAPAVDLADVAERFGRALINRLR